MPSAKTFAANKSLPPLDGLVFPITGKDKNGADERSTQVTGKNCVAAALAAVDKEAALGQSRARRRPPRGGAPAAATC